MSNGLSALQPELQPYAEELVRQAGLAGLLPRVTSTVRTRAAQERLYRRFLAGLQPYPVARPGTSAHEFGWAFDMVVSPMEALSDVGAYWEGMGGVWGGHPTRAGSSYDPVHFEYPGWRQLAQAGSASPAPDRDLLFPPTVAESLPVIGGLATAQRLGEEAVYDVSKFLADFFFPSR